MPLVKVELRSGKSAEYRNTLLDLIHNALVEALKIPETDRLQRMYELDAEHFELPPGKSENFVLIEITLFAGRSRQAKCNLYQSIVRKAGELLGLAPQDVFIVLQEPPLENWAIKGQPADAVELGFEIKV